MASLYLDEGLDPAVVPAMRIRFGGDEARHAATVARVRPGERIAVGTGAGVVAWGTVTEVGSEVELDVAEVHREDPPSPQLWLAQALAKGDRDELAVQAATELGVSGVIPWAAERSVSRWEGAKVARGRARWSSIVREATKQSIRSHVPEVAPLATTRELAREPGRLLVLEPSASVLLSEVDLYAERIVLVAGPEGGISARELDVLAEAGATPVRLGAEVLRTSTAGPAALAALNVRLGRW